jgi:hypothetical protein
LTATQLAGGFGLLEAQALPRRIEESFVSRLEALPDDARLLLLVAAAEPVGDPVLLSRAAERLGIGPAAADGVRDQDLLTIGERVMFRHPLVRSGVYRSATAEERRAAHSALAESTDKEADPDRRAWHLAAAAEGPDEQIAVELERSAGRAQARGGRAAAAAFLHRAVTLTQNPERRAERALGASQASFQAGAFDVALGLLATAEDGPLDGFQRARAELVRGQVAFASFSADAATVLSRAYRQPRPRRGASNGPPRGRPPPRARGAPGKFPRPGDPPGPQRSHLRLVRALAGDQLQMADDGRAASCHQHAPAIAIRAHRRG